VQFFFYIISVGCSDDAGRATAISGHGEGEERTQVDVMAAAMSPSHRRRQRNCLAACADNVRSAGGVSSCIWQHCSWDGDDVDSAEVSMNTMKRWGNRICMETHCSGWRGDIDKYFSCGLQNCS